MGNRDATPKQQNISQTTRRRARAPGQPALERRNSRTKPAAGIRLAGSGLHEGETRLARLLQLAADFNATLNKCAAGAEVEAVHRIRSGSRRIQAIVETMLRENGARARPLKQPARMWLRQLKRLRRAAGPVRDLDVHRRLLKKPLADWIERSAAAEEEEPAAGRAVEPGIAAKHGVQCAMPPTVAAAIPEVDRLQGQAARLADWINNERRVRAEAFEKLLEKHRPKLEEPEIAFLAAADRMRAPGEKATRRAAVVALHDFARLADAMPMLGADNLHEFRKSVKKARYVAESDGDEKGLRTVAKALKRMQDAIGAWHDWLCLTREAQIALGDDGAELTAWLGIETGRRFTHALAITERLRGELLGEWLAARSRTGQRQTGTGPVKKLPSRAAAAVSAKKPRAS